MDRSLDVGLIEIVTDQPTLERRHLGQDELNVIVAPGHPLTFEKAVRADQLAAQPLLHREPGNGIRDLVDQFFTSAGIPYEDLNVTAELGSLSSVKHLAAAGLGVAVLEPLFAETAVFRSPFVHRPIVGRAGYDNLYLNAGWGTGGFKVTPGIGWCLAETIATGREHDYVAPFSLDRFVTGALVDEHGAAPAQGLHDVLVVDDLLAHVDRCTIQLQRLLDGVNGPIHPGTISARSGQEDPTPVQRRARGHRGRKC